MNWFYAVGGQQQGPVDDAELDRLIAAGTLAAETLVWREGMSGWQPLRVARPGRPSAPAAGLPPIIGTGTSSQAPGAGPAPGEVMCAECGKFFPRDNTIQYGTAFVCAVCKPIFIQKLREGTAAGTGPLGQPGVPFDPDVFLAAVRERDYAIDIGSCFSRGWELVKSNFWLCVGAFVVVYGCLVGSSLIPCAGAVLPTIIQGPLMGGMYVLFLKLIRGQEAKVGDAFSGFSKAFLQLFLVGLVSALLTGLCLIPGLVTIVAVSQFGANIPPLLIGFLFLLGLVPAVYLSICWIFSMQLVVDKGMNFWAAMELSRKVVNLHWVRVFLFLIVCGLVAMLGLVGLCLGFLVTAPLALAAFVYAYEDIFGDQRPQLTS